MAVSSDTKIQIWKQFTTLHQGRHGVSQLCHPIQRYKFESNSQHHGAHQARQAGCVIRYKDTNLKAIHNTYNAALWPHKAVSSDTKIQIWKQFTTQAGDGVHRVTLCHPIQRYKFESNSQLGIDDEAYRVSCVIRYKDTNLKAIHNRRVPRARGQRAVSSDTKIQIWKQFTTASDPCPATRMLCHPIQRYKFESNSQPNMMLK